MIPTSAVRFAEWTSSKSRKKAVEYTCPMHPEIVQNEPGNCPICGMDLVPKPSKDNDHEDETYKLLRRKFWTALDFLFLFLFYRWAECLLIGHFLIKFRDFRINFDIAGSVLCRLVSDETWLGFFQNMES
jgi:hypothetical protein